MKSNRAKSCPMRTANPGSRNRACAMPESLQAICKPFDSRGETETSSRPNLCRLPAALRYVQDIHVNDGHLTWWLDSRPEPGRSQS